MIVNTRISYGYAELIKIFCEANELQITIHDTSAALGKLHLYYDDESPTAQTITFMSFKHLGLENMLCDYLIRCGISPSLIGIGSYTPPRDMKELDKKWEEHKRLIGLR